MDAPTVLTLSLALAVFVAYPAAAQVYKWVDASGVVTYGDRPPPNASKLGPLDEGNARLSIVPGMPREEIERERERGLRQRLEQAEQEIADLRTRPTTVVVQPNPDDYPLYATYPAYPYWPRRVHGRPLPPHKTQLPVPPPLHGGPVRRAPAQRY